MCRYQSMSAFAREAGVLFLVAAHFLRERTGHSSYHIWLGIKHMEPRAA